MKTLAMWGDETPFSRPIMEEVESSTDNNDILQIIRNNNCKFAIAINTDVDPTVDQSDLYVLPEQPLIDYVNISKSDKEVISNLVPHMNEEEKAAHLFIICGSKVLPLKKNDFSFIES